MFRPKTISDCITEPMSHVNRLRGNNGVEPVRDTVLKVTGYILTLGSYKPL